MAWTLERGIKAAESTAKRHKKSGDLAWAKARSGEGGYYFEKARMHYGIEKRAIASADKKRAKLAALSTLV